MKRVLTAVAGALGMLLVGLCCNAVLRVVFDAGVAAFGKAFDVATLVAIFLALVVAILLQMD